jgi:hypothetical protein
MTGRLSSSNRAPVVASRNSNAGSALRYANRTAYTGGSVWLTQAQLSPWSSLTHRPPVVEPKASRSPASSRASAWR